MRKTTKRVLGILMAAMMCVCTLFCLTGCGDNANDAITELFENYTTAITEENIDNYMACIDSGSATIDIANIKAAMESVYASYDLKASVNRLEIVTADEEAGVATVNVTIEYINTGETAYVDNRVSGEYSLVLKDGKWLITNSVMQSVEYIDGVPASDSDVTYSVPDDTAVTDDVVDGNDALSAEPNLDGALG